MLTLRRRLLGTQDRNLGFWAFVGPFFLGLLVFVYIPILRSIWLSFSTPANRQRDDLRHGTVAYLAAYDLSQNGGPNVRTVRPHQAAWL